MKTHSSDENIKLSVTNKGSSISKEDFGENSKYKVLSSVPTDKTLFNNDLLSERNSLIDKQTENLLHVGKALLFLLV